MQKTKHNPRNRYNIQEFQSKNQSLDGSNSMKNMK
jgi:hypothetical protein